MPTLGLVLTLESGEGAPRQATLDRLALLPELWLGEPVGPRLPVVLDLPAVQGSAPVEDRVAGLIAVPGVVFADVVYTDFADMHPDPGEAPEKAVSEKAVSEREESSWS